VAHLLPLKEDDDSLFDALTDGFILYKMIQTIKPIDTKKYKISPPV